MKNIIIIAVLAVEMLSILSCKKNVTPQSDSLAVKNTSLGEIERIKNYFEEMRNKKKSRATINLSDDSLVYYIEADLNIQLGRFSYDKDVVTTNTVDVNIPCSSSGYNSNDILTATNTIKTSIQNKFNELNNSSNPGLVVLYIDVEIIDSSPTLKKLRGHGIYASNVDKTAYDRYPENNYRFWPSYCNAYPEARGYCSDPDNGKRTSSLQNFIPGFMTIVGRQKYVDYLFPNGLPQQYQYIAIDINHDIIQTSYIAATNPYRPSFHYTMWFGQTFGVCFNVAELIYYMNLSHPRISATVSNWNQSYLTHYWSTNIVGMQNPPNPHPNDFDYGEDDIFLTVGNLVPYNQ